MTWVRFEDRFPWHRKVRRLSDAAFRLHVSTICWSTEHLTNGHVPEDDLELTSDVRDAREVVVELVRRGEWHAPGHDCDHCPAVSDGWIVHDFLVYQQSADQVRRAREQAAERQRRARERARESRRDDRVCNGPPDPTRPDPLSEDKSSEETSERADVQRLCIQLADKIEANGSRRPTVTQKWRDAARLLLDKDGRTEQQISNAIEWCQADEFWRANVLSMPKLRDKYDQLRLAAQRPRAPTAAGEESTTDRRVRANLEVVRRLGEQERGVR